MGEIAEMMLNGDMCEQCGEWIGDGDGPGYPGLCAGCRRETRPYSSKPHKCPHCAKRFRKDVGVRDHVRTVHALAKESPQ